MGQMLDYVYGLLPSRLGRPRGRRLLKALGDEADRYRDAVAFGVQQTMIEEAGTETYGAHERNSAIIPVAAETSAAVLTELRRRWLTARESGGADAIVRILGRLGFPGCTVVSQLDLGLLGHTGAFGGFQGFFYVDVPSGLGFTDPIDWDSGDTWDGTDTWDLSEPYRGALADMTYVIQRTKHACSSCRFLLIHLPSGATATVPMWERWERLPDGSYRDFFNTGY